MVFSITAGCEFAQGKIPRRFVALVEIRPAFLARLHMPQAPPPSSFLFYPNRKNSQPPHPAIGLTNAVVKGLVDAMGNDKLAVGYSGFGHIPGEDNKATRVRRDK